MERQYKDYRIYSCIVLNRLASELGINLYQKDLETKLDSVLDKEYSVTKADVMHEIRSNHKMTEKVLAFLEKEGWITIIPGERGYKIRITKEGILHLQKFNEFYIKLYEGQIRNHYKYRGEPNWIREVFQK